jgi:8-oxo-dGTP diphosphatase
MNPIVRFGAGRTARHAAERYAAEQWAHGHPARAVFRADMQGWVVRIYDPPNSRHEIPGAGRVLWRSRAQGLEIALVRPAGTEAWMFPSGDLHDSETPVLAAVREVATQTGHRLVIGRRLPTRSVPTPRGVRVVQYWAMHALGDTHAVSPEAVTLMWLAPSQARRRLVSRDDVGLIQAVGSVRIDSAVLLTRHASAGDPSRWHGPDARRPLDTEGIQQAAALQRTLPLFGVSRVLAAPNARCVDTVAPLANALGLAVEQDAALSEEGYAHHPDAGLQRLRELAEATSTTVLCSQGAVIPDVVARLAGQDGLPIGEVKAKKGSVRALFFAHGRLVAADYYPTWR